MHREIQIKQFPIVTTHWWPKTRNERFVWENQQYLYRFYLLYTTMSKWSECAHIRCVTCVCVCVCVCVRSLWLTLHSHGASRQRLTEGVSEAWCWCNFSSANGGVSQSDRLMQIPNPVHATPEKYVIGCCNYDGASAPRFRHALRQALTLDLIWISLCMFFFPLIETVTYTCHYMTDRLERFDLKTSKLDLLKKKRHLHLGCPWGKLIDTTF